VYHTVPIRFQAVRYDRDSSTESADGDLSSGPTGQNSEQTGHFRPLYWLGRFLDPSSPRRSYSRLATPLVL